MYCGRKVLLYMLLPFLLAVFPCAAQTDTEKKTITVEEAVSLAVSNNLDLQKEEINRRSAERKKKSAWNSLLPAVSIGGSLGYSWSFLDNGNTAGSSSDPWRASVSAGVSLSLNAGIPAQIRSILLSYDSAEISYEEAKTQLEIQVAKTFYSLIASAINIDISKNNLLLAQSQYEQTQRNYNSGLASELSLLQAQYTVESLKPEIQKLESDYNYNLKSFYSVLGFPYDADIELSGSISIQQLYLPDASQLFVQYSGRRYDLASLENAVESAKLSKQSATLTKLAPSVSLGANWSLSDLLKPSDLIDSGSFSLSVSIPLNGFIPGSSDYLSIKDSADSVTLASIALAQGRKDALLDIDKNVFEINRLWETVSVCELNEGIAERSYELAVQGYNAGLVTQTDLESERQKLLEVQQSLLQSKLDYLNAVYDLSYALQISVEELYATYSAET